MALIEMNFASGGGITALEYDYSVTFSNYRTRAFVLPLSKVKSIFITQTNSANANLYCQIYPNADLGTSIVTKNTSLGSLEYTQTEIENYLTNYSNAYVIAQPDGGSDTVIGHIKIELTDN